MTKNLLFMLEGIFLGYEAVTLAGTLERELVQGMGVILWLTFLLILFVENNPIPTPPLPSRRDRRRLMSQLLQSEPT